MPNWLIPWIVAGLAIWPLVLLERWVDKHIQGLGYLLTNNGQAAVLIWYLALLPGVVLHEGSQWVLAKLLRVRVKKFQLWPDKQGRVVRLGLVEIDRNTDRVRATLVGMVPLVAGVAAITIIGSTRFDTGLLASGLASGDFPTLFASIREFVSVPDFWLWVYLVFAIANAMLPEEHDRINWWLFVIAGGAILGVLLLLDLGILIQVWLTGPFAQLGEWLSFALVLAVLLDLFVMGLLALSEAVFTRLLQRDVTYTR